MRGRWYGEEVGISSILEGLVKVKGIARNEDFGVQ
jgi:hypothetical protein